MDRVHSTAVSPLRVTRPLNKPLSLTTAAPLDGMPHNQLQTKRLSMCRRETADHRPHHIPSTPLGHSGLVTQRFFSTAKEGRAFEATLPSRRTGTNEPTFGRTA
jgi:hypothetical protein